MDLLDEAAILDSPVVANNRMNRERGYRGVNSYVRELRFDPLEFLAATGARPAKWLDVGCGSGRALVEAADEAEARGLADRIRIVGVDLVDFFVPAARRRGPIVRVICRSIRDLALEGPFDLVTFVHSLHYLADKLSVIEDLYERTRPDGFLAGHLDPENLRGARGERLRGPLSAPRRSGLPVSLSRGLLRLTRVDAPLRFGRRFLGCRPSDGPNRTGQRAVDSHYGE